MMSFGRRLVKWGSSDNSRIGGGEIIYEGSCTLVRKVVVLKSRKICRGMEKSAPEIFLKKIKEFVDSCRFLDTVLNPDGDHGCCHGNVLHRSAFEI